MYNFANSSPLDFIVNVTNIFCHFDDLDLSGEEKSPMKTGKSLQGDRLSLIICLLKFYQKFKNQSNSNYLSCLDF
jgi:hypothetical protein